MLCFRFPSNIYFSMQSYEIRLYKFVNVFVGEQCIIVYMFQVLILNQLVPVVKYHAEIKTLMKLLLITTRP